MCEMVKLKMNTLALFSIALALTLLHVTEAGPVVILRRSKREIYPEIEEEKVEDGQTQVCVVGDVVYEAEDSVPAELSCMKCKCQPPGVHCEAISCQKKPGCRTIHKPNTCCPEYQCECEFEGRTYANGERLEQKPSTECKVCYCRGGEVQCAEVSCYHRNDCEGRKVPGQCCPKYDHCPPREPTKTELVKEALFDNESNNETSGNAEDQHQQQPEDDQITIQEIIPEVKEIPITSSPKRLQQAHIVLVTTDEQEETSADSSTARLESNDLEVTDVDSDSSEIAEVYQQPPPILRIGDKLLILKKGELVPENAGVSTPATVITVVGAEGLQRGGLEETLENKTQEPEAPVRNDEEEDIQDVAESTHILSLVNRKRLYSTTTTESSINETIFDNASYLNESSDVEDFNVTSSPSNLEDVTKNDTEVSAKNDMEINPEYPPLPDVMSPQIDETEVSDNNKTVSLASTDWLKETLMNPEEVFSENITEFDSVEMTNATTEFLINETLSTTSEAQSAESMEEITESGESVTEPNLNQSASSIDMHQDAEDLDASIETFKMANDSTLVETIPGFESAGNLSQKTPKKEPKDVEIVDVVASSIDKSKKNKRENMEDDNIFEELNREIGLEDGTIVENKSAQEEEQEARAIFDELIDEATSRTTQRPLKVTGNDQQSSQAAMLQKITDAIAKLTLRDSKSHQNFDVNVLGVLRDLFSAQYRAYANQKFN